MLSPRSVPVGPFMLLSKALLRYAAVRPEIEVTFDEKLLFATIAWPTVLKRSASSPPAHRQGTRSPDAGINLDPSSGLVPTAISATGDTLFVDPAGYGPTGPTSGTTTPCSANRANTPVVAIEVLESIGNKKARGDPLPPPSRLLRLSADASQQLRDWRRR